MPEPEKHFVPSIDGMAWLAVLNGAADTFSDQIAWPACQGDSTIYGVLEELRLVGTVL